MTEKVKRKLNGAASKMLATITGRTIDEEARNPTNKRSDEGPGQKMELAGARPTHARAPPGAPSLLNCVGPTHETLSQTYQI